MLRYLVFYDSSVVILTLVFQYSFLQCYSVGSNFLLGRVLSIGL